MFGFPETLSEWGPREYLRLFAFIAFYLTIRPLIQKFYTRLGERQREREKKKAEEEQIRRNQQQRVKEKLEQESATSVTPESRTTLRERRRNERNARKKQEVENEQLAAKDVIHDGMPSDDDVSDLLA